MDDAWDEGCGAEDVEKGKTWSMEYEKNRGGEVEREEIRRGI